MNVTIRERNAIYIPDYTPTNLAWKIQLQDAHRLVTIAGTVCFVKRFERLLPAWDFLIANRGKRHLGLPLIYDAQSRAENGKTVYYLFLEKIEGELLHDVIRTGGTANGTVLGRSMASAFRVLRAQGYWHADFCTKNIMVTTVGKQFLLIDLDSLEPATTPPSSARNQPGYIPDQELAIYAANYVRAFVQPTLKNFTALPGPVLNQLQLVFLLDKLVYFAVVLKPQGERFGQKKNFEQLSDQVHKHLGAYTNNILLKILTGQPITDEMLLSQGSNFQSQLQVARTSGLPTSPVSQTAKQPPSLSAAPASKPTSTPTPAYTPRRTASLTSQVASIGYLRTSKKELKPGESTCISWGTIGASSVSLTYYPSLSGSGAFTLTYDELVKRTGKTQGIVELTLTLGLQGPKQTITIALKPASAPLQLPVSPAPPASTKPSYSQHSVSQAGLVKPNRLKVVSFYVAIIVALIGCIIVYNDMLSLKAKAASFVPNQQRGLELFDEEKYDSSYVHLVNFRADTSHSFATQFNLAFMYDFGLGTPVNDSLACSLYVECLRSPAPKVASDALYLLGMSYLLGEGVVQDTATAKKCFTIAVDNFDNQDARAALQKL